ncbi:MAG: ABC transporter substrate-binding protein [Peptostreptococcaceae bacterium]|nr:ABC transporter substrate-binding protein [Peptostreptococcaceae bacterium]
MKKKWILAVALTFALLLTGCQGAEKKEEVPAGQQEPAEQTEENDEGPILIGQTWVVSNTDPTDSSVPWSMTSHGVSETVFMLDDKGILHSRFIDSFEKIDELTWKATTKNEAKFSNGDIVDAPALAECMNKIQQSNPLSNATAGKVEFKAVDDRTLEIKTERPLQRFDSFLTEWSNVVFKDLGEGNFAYTGPYVIDGLDKGISLSLRPNPEYPEAETRKDVKVMAFKDASALKLAFEAGEIDLAFTVTPEVAKMLRDGGKTVKTIEAGYQYFGIFNLDSALLKDPAVRKAINLGIDREEYIKALQGGRVATGFFAGYYDFAGDIEIKRGMEEANALLDQAGYRMTDGVREKDGKKLEIRLVTYPSRPDLSVIMQIMASQLKELGFEVKTEVVDGIDKVASSGDFELILYAQHTAPTGDPSFALNQFFRTGEGKNHSKYSSEKMDSLLDKLGSEQDQAKRTELAKEIQNLIFEDLPVLYLVDPQWNIAVSERIEGYQPYNGDYYIVNDQLGK